MPKPPITPVPEELAGPTSAPPWAAAAHRRGSPEAHLAQWRHVENTLRDSDEKYRLLIENANESIFIAQDGVIRCPNPRMVQITGYTADELSAMPFTELVAEEDRAMVADRHQRRLRGEPVPNQYQFRLKRRDNDRLWIEINVVKIDWEGHAATLCFVRDISEQKRAEAALRDSQAMYRSLVENLPMVMIRKDLAGQFTFGNRRFCEFVGRPLDEIVGRTDVDFFPAERAAKYQADDRRVCTSGETFEDVEEHFGADGRTIYVQVIKTPVYDAQDCIIGTQGIFWDITERKRAEEAIERAREIAERENLQREVTEISTRERQRISRDLHDSVGQELTGVSYMAKSLARKLSTQELPEAAAANDVVEGIQHALAAVRAAIRGLTPVEVDADGLMAALEQLATNTRQRYDVDCHFDREQPVPVEDNKTATHLFHIAQEAVLNAVKHSRATSIAVALAAEDGQITLRVRDDGVGFDPSALATAGMGLRIMEYRAAMIGARLRVGPAAGSGMEVSCTLRQETAHVVEAAR